MKKLWGGRFSEKTESSVESFTESVSFDARLWRHDIEGSIAHVTMLGRQKIILKKEADLIIKGLRIFMPKSRAANSDSVTILKMFI